MFNETEICLTTPHPPLHTLSQGAVFVRPAHPTRVSLNDVDIPRRRNPVCKDVVHPRVLREWVGTSSLSVSGQDLGFPMRYRRAHQAPQWYPHPLQKQKTAQQASARASLHKHRITLKNRNESFLI